MRKTKLALIGIGLLVGVLTFSNVGCISYVTIPSLENFWWAGYYDSHLSGRQWCVAVFDRDSTGSIKMALLSRTGEPGIMQVDRRSWDRNFVDLVIKNDLVRIEAKQLYLGKRYIYQRLLVGRFGDFLEMNEDVSIRGKLSSLSPPNEFALESLDHESLARFWQVSVKRDDGLTPGELLESVGFAIPVRKPTGPPPPEPMARWSEEERAGFYTFEAALDAYSRGVHLMEQLVNMGETSETADTAAYVGELREALVNAVQVPASALDRAHPQLRERFQEDFQVCLMMLIEGDQMKDGNLAQLGGNSCDRFILWLNSHWEEIEANKNR